MHPMRWISYHASRTPEKTAVTDLATGHAVDYADFKDRILRLATVLTDLGLSRGDRLLVLALNDSRVFETLYACSQMGIVMVPLNWRLAPTEIDAILDDFGPSAVLLDEECSDLFHRLSPRFSGLPHLVWGRENSSYEMALCEARPVQKEPQSGDDDPVVIIYTSGTTGVPKGAVHTVRSMTANVENSVFSGEVSSTSVALTVLPTFHVAGLHLYANAALMMGGSVLIMRSFDPQQTLDLFTDDVYEVTHFCGVPANFQFMSGLPDFPDTNFRPINATVGGSPVPQAMVHQWAAQGILMRSIFGATEAGSSLLAMPPRGSEGPSAVGSPVIHAEAKIASLDGDDMQPGEVGELLVRGPMVMKEYWNRPDETAAAVDQDGWLHTGDAAFSDESGIFHIVDRWKDMYISGGENVYPAEIEGVLYRHPDVTLASVIGVPDDRWGEVGRAFVVTRSGQSIDDELRSWCRQHLATFKVPASFQFMEDLPKNATGKILKTALRKTADHGR